MARRRRDDQLDPMHEVDRNSLATALHELEAAKLRVERDARAVADDMRKQLVQELLPVLRAIGSRGRYCDLARSWSVSDATDKRFTVVEGCTVCGAIMPTRNLFARSTARVCITLA
jgi:hypothetical protein